MVGNSLSYGVKCSGVLAILEKEVRVRSKLYEYLEKKIGTRLVWLA